MKILHVITLAELGGAQSVVLNLACESIKEGHDVMVASSVVGELWNVLPEQVHHWKIETLKREISLLNERKVLKELRLIYQNFKPDIIHLHSSKIGVLGRLAFPKAKIIYTVHGFDSIRVAFRKFLHLEKALQLRAKSIVGVSKYDYHNLLAEGIRKNVGYIYNGITDYSKKDDHQESDSFTRLRDLILSKPGFKVMCIARISPQKKFDLFCEVANSMVSQKINFFWIGNREEMKNVPANVHCLGETDHAHRLLKYTDLFMLPTNYEGMPMSILEALCYAVPVVASNVGGIGEILNGRNGKAVSNTVSDFSNPILYYANNADEFAAARIEARKSYEQYFTVETMYQAYLSLYQAVR